MTMTARSTRLRIAKAKMTAVLAGMSPRPLILLSHVLLVADISAAERGAKWKAKEGMYQSRTNS